MHAAARSTDPASSWEAAEHLTASGKMAKLQALTFAAVDKWPGKTSLELAEASGLCRFMLARRLSEVEALGRIYRGPARKSAGSNRSGDTWLPVKPNQQLELIA